MSAGDAPRLELPPELRSVLEKLHKLFVWALADARLNSCWSAWADIKRTRNAKTKIEIFNEKSSQWREGSADAIREWLPKFVDLATAYPGVIDDPIHWAKNSVRERVEVMCGIQRPHEGELLPRDWVPNEITVWWFAVASEGNPKVNLPPLRPWSAPRWLARDRRETEDLLETHAGYLCIRINRVIEDAIAVAEIRRASNRKVEEHKAETQSAKHTFTGPVVPFENPGVKRAIIVEKIRREIIEIADARPTPPTPSEQTSSPSPSHDDSERLAEQMAEWNRDLVRISRAAQAKRQYQEKDARKDFPELTLWKALDDSNINPLRRREFFANPWQNFGTQVRRFDLIGQLTGRASSTAYDIYKRRPSRRKRSRKI
jgi:hypothetical protein